LFLEPAYLKYSTFQITSSLKQQYKLLLEQKAIKYVYPGDSSPTTREGAWQRSKVWDPRSCRPSKCDSPISGKSSMNVRKLALGSYSFFHSLF